MLPLTARTNADGHLEIGGCDTVELADRFGTPLFIKDEATIREQCRRFIKAFAANPDVPSDVIYAGKAFLCLAMCQIIMEEGLALDVASGGELYTALKAGFPADKIFMHGNNKTRQELELALDNRAGRVVVDSLDELALLNELSGARGLVQPILLRVTPGIKPDTHSYIQTGQIDSKFGFNLNGDAALKACAVAQSLENIEFKGLHAHIGSQIFELQSYAKAIELIVDFMDKIQRELDLKTKELNTGGGLGIQYTATEAPSTIEDYARIVLTEVKKQCDRLSLDLPKVMVEPGRSIVGNAGVTVYEVGTVKEIPGIRTYVSVDGGMSDNLRPMLYGAAYEVLLANRAGEKANSRVTVAGKHCESGDILVKDAELPAPKVGDLLCTPVTGAYGYAMANNYNKQPKPAVVLVRDGKARLIIRREAYEDVVRLENL